MKRRYRRYFIMLELEDKDFGALAGEEIKGYAKVEIRNNQGLLSIYCQNIKISSNGYEYRWYLINTKTDGAPIIVEIEPMKVDEKGKGETICEFDAENVKGSGEQIDNFDVLVLVAQDKDEKDKLYVPLVGYTDKKRPDAGSWRYALGKHLNVSLDKKATGEKAKPSFQPAVKEIAEDVAEGIKIIEGIAKERAAEDIKKGLTEKVIKESIEEATEEIEEETAEGIIKELAEESAEEAAGEIEKESKKEHKGGTPDGPKAEQEDNDLIKTEENEYEAQMQAYIENSLRGFLRVEPFVEGLKNYVWWQIPYDTRTMYRAYMPFISYLDSLKDPADFYVSKTLQVIYIHQHHIFGICYDKNNRAKHYAYGILGRNLSSEQPFELDEDLVYWYPCDDVPINIESYGYWILMIDPETGDAIKQK